MNLLVKSDGRHVLNSNYNFVYQDSSGKNTHGSKYTMAKHILWEIVYW